VEALVCRTHCCLRRCSFFLLFHQLLDAMFSTSFVRALSMSFQFILISGLAVRRAISKSFAAVVIMVIECRSN